VYTDEEIVEQMLRNLVSNAVRYTEHGKILIGCRRRDTQLQGKRSIKPPLSMFLKSGAYILLSKGEMLYEGFEYGGCKGGVDRSH